MIITTYRFIRSRIQAQRNEVPHQEISGGTSEQPDNRRKWDSETWKWRISLAVSLAIPVFLETLDQTVVATAVPQIASYFKRLDLQSYIGTVYLLTGAVFLLPFSSIADIYGRHAALQLSLIFFILGSALSTGARNMEMMIAGRGIAGVGAAGLLAVVRIIMSDSESLDDNNWQSAMLFLLYTAGYCVGPPVGGILASVSFRWIFFLNLPTSIIAMILAAVLLRKGLKGSEDMTDSPIQSPIWLQRLLRIDWIGSSLFVVGGILILLALNWGSTERWNSVKVIASFVVGGVVLVLFSLWEGLLKYKNANIDKSQARGVWMASAMLPLDVFRSLDICIVQLASFVSGMVMLCMFYFVAIFATVVINLDATNAGVQLLFYAPGLGIGALISIHTVKWLRQPKIPIVLGSLLLPIAIGLLSRAVKDQDNGRVKGYLIFAGIGTGAAATSLPVHARFSQPPNRVAVVASLNLFSRALGGSFGIAQLATILQTQSRRAIENAVKAGLFPTSDLGVLGSLGGQLNSIETISKLSPEGQTIVRRAFSDAVWFSFLSLVPWAGITFFAVLFLSNIRDGDRPTPDEQTIELNDRGKSQDVTKEVTSASASQNAV